MEYRAQQECITNIAIHTYYQAVFNAKQLIDNHQSTLQLSDLNRFLIRNCESQINSYLLNIPMKTYDNLYVFMHHHVNHFANLYKYDQYKLSQCVQYLNHEQQETLFQIVTKLHVHSSGQYLNLKPVYQIDDIQKNVRIQFKKVALNYNNHHPSIIKRLLLEQIGEWYNQPNDIQEFPYQNGFQNRQNLYFKNSDLEPDFYYHLKNINPKWNSYEINTLLYIYDISEDTEKKFINALIHLI